MLEGAKSIGAGAATIALAGAAVGIGNVCSSLIHSVARNPSLAKQPQYAPLPIEKQILVILVFLARLLLRALFLFRFSYSFFEFGLGPSHVLPDMNGITDIDGNTVDLNIPNFDGNTIDLNTRPSPVELLDNFNFETSPEYKGRHLKMETDLTRLNEAVSNLESEQDPVRRQEKVEHLNTLIRELEVSVDRNRSLDSREIWKRDHFSKVVLEESEKLKNQQSKYTLLNSWLKVLIQTRDRKPR